MVWVFCIDYRLHLLVKVTLAMKKRAEASGLHLFRLMSKIMCYCGIVYKDSNNNNLMIKVISTADFY